ncbi:MAG: NAD(P)-binding domain-containing protein [Clostridia bacterium]|nr:NAD(P)-binding domain-containing protein [Clostridia bacterium]
MIYSKSIVICGGDNRQRYMYEFMKQKGLDVSTFALDSEDNPEALKKYDVIILPVPVTKDGVHLNGPYGIKLDDIKDVICPGQLVLGGMCNGIDAIDYYLDEAFQTQNAIPTAEGALQVAMENTDITINKSHCAVLGYGRIGKILSSMLKNMGAEVTVCARNPKDLSLAKAFGFNVMHINYLENMGSFDIIFNTVPNVVMDSVVLGSTRKDVLLTELASKPYGIDMEAAEKLGRNVIIASGLPGKVAPKTAGKILCDVILDILGGVEFGT